MARVVRLYAACRPAWSWARIEVQRPRGTRRGGNRVIQALARLTLAFMWCSCALTFAGCDRGGSENSASISSETPTAGAETSDLTEVLQSNALTDLAVNPSSGEGWAVGQGEVILHPSLCKQITRHYRETHKAQG